MTKANSVTDLLSITLTDTKRQPDLFPGCSLFVALHAGLQKLLMDVTKLLWRVGEPHCGRFSGCVPRDDKHQKGQQCEPFHSRHPKEEYNGPRFLVRQKSKVGTGLASYLCAEAGFDRISVESLGHYERFNRPYAGPWVTFAQVRAIVNRICAVPVHFPRYTSS